MTQVIDATPKTNCQKKNILATFGDPKAANFHADRREISIPGKNTCLYNYILPWAASSN